MSSPKKKRKLIFLWTYLKWGGAQLYLLTIMRYAAEFWDIVVLLPKETKQEVIDFYKPFNIPLEFLTYHVDSKVESTIVGKLGRQWERIRSEIETYLHLQKYDLKESILHIEISPWQSWILLVFLSIKGANVFITLNNFRPEASFFRRAIWKARFQIISRLPGLHIFASNKDAKESLRQWLTPSFMETVDLGYSPIDREQIANILSKDDIRRSLRSRFGIDNETFVVLAVGQFVDRKGRWIFLEAAKKVLEKRRDVQFVWLMPDEITEEDQPRVDSYELDENFLPVLSSSLGSDRESILSFFRIADIFALPSFVEGLPIALLEAMALRLPSISTNVYAIPEAVIDGETGILIEAGDSDALAKSILRLRDDSALRDRLSSTGSRFAVEHFDGRAMAAAYLKRYRQCFEGRE